MLASQWDLRLCAFQDFYSYSDLQKGLDSLREAWGQGTSTL